MRSVFGENLLRDMTKSIKDSWTDNCPLFTDEEINEITTIVDEYQHAVQQEEQRAKALKIVVVKLAILVMDMCPVKTSAVNSIRRLIENIPLTPIKYNSPAETEVWSMFSDPILRSIFNLPDQCVHLRWTNKKIESSESHKRPDSTVNAKEQQQYSKDWGYGEVKTFEPTNDNHMLAKDLIRIGLFNKRIINKQNVRSAIVFQINGFRLTFYVVELNFKHVYTMTELLSIEIPQSIEQIDRLVTKNSLRALCEVAHVFDNIRTTSLRCSLEVFEKKKSSSSSNFEDLEPIIAKKRDRNSPCTYRF